MDIPAPVQMALGVENEPKLYSYFKCFNVSMKMDTRRPRPVKTIQRRESLSSGRKFSIW